MPRRNKSARLWLRPESKKHGSIVRRSAWVILDGGKHFATGCLAHEIEKAEHLLAEHVAIKYEPSRKRRDIELIDVADVLTVYLNDTGTRQSSKAKFDGRINRLNDFFGAMKLAEITGERCREYVGRRGNNGGARRDLEDLRAAIEHHAKEGLHRGVVRVTLPRRGPPRTRWLTRHEVAALLRACWRYREVQSIHKGGRKGEVQETAKRPLRHLARFILFALYSGTRSGAILVASANAGPGRSFVDLERGLFYRLAEGAQETNKRQPPVPLPPRLLAHLRRWFRLGVVNEYFIEWHGKPIHSVKTAFDSAIKLSGLPGKVTPHTLRHTAATWLMQSGVDKWEAAGFLGMSVETLDRVYGHHHPHHLRNAARALGYRPHEKLAISLAAADRPASPRPQTADIVGGPGRTRTCNQTVMSGRL
jgi:integrase